MNFNDLMQFSDDMLKKMFGDRIKQNFLMQMRDEVIKKYGLKQLYSDFGCDDVSINFESLLKGNPDTRIDYEICRNITAIHRCLTGFDDNETRAKKQNDSNYIDNLVDQVINHIKLRNYSGKFIRTVPMMAGDELIFFPIPYKLLAICNYANYVLNKHRDLEFYNFYTMIFNKGIATLTLIENIILDSAYPICRAVIELYMKMMFIILNPNAMVQYKKFCHLDLDKGCYDKYPDEFITLFNNRKNQKLKNKVNYMHFGWVDCSNDYFDLVEDRKQYSMDGLFDYAILKAEDEDAKQTFLDLRYLYGFCHSFTHATTGNATYPIVFYFDIIGILMQVIPATFKLLCYDLNIDTNIDGIDVFSLLEKDSIVFYEQLDKRSNEFFDSFYATFKPFHK